MRFDKFTHFDTLAYCHFIVGPKWGFDIFGVLLRFDILTFISHFILGNFSYISLSITFFCITLPKDYNTSFTPHNLNHFITK